MAKVTFVDCVLTSHSNCGYKKLRRKVLNIICAVIVTHGAHSLAFLVEDGA